jgi:hypothetical protein
MQHTQQLSKECLSETTVVTVVPSDPAKISSMLSMAQERLLHPQTAVQVYADTLFLNSLTREHLVEEKVTPLAYARRRLAVFELGILAVLRCSVFASEENRYVFEALDRERIAWDDRVWGLLEEPEENTHHPIGFFNQKM